MSESWGDPVKKIPETKICPIRPVVCKKGCPWAVPHTNEEDKWFCSVYVIAFHVNQLVRLVEVVEPKK